MMRSCLGECAEVATLLGAMQVSVVRLPRGPQGGQTVGWKPAAGAQCRVSGPTNYIFSPGIDRNPARSAMQTRRRPYTSPGVASALADSLPARLTGGSLTTLLRPDSFSHSLIHLAQLSVTLRGAGHGVRE